jgi:hypothetical protein
MVALLSCTTSRISHPDGKALKPKVAQGASNAVTIKLKLAALIVTPASETVDGVGKLCSDSVGLGEVGRTANVVYLHSL